MKRLTPLFKRKMKQWLLIGIIPHSKDSKPLVPIFRSPNKKMKNPFANNMDSLKRSDGIG